MPYAAVPFERGSHERALIRLWADNLSDRLLGGAAEERLRWIYEENPSGPSRTFLAVETGSQAVIGCGSFFPWTKWVDGRPLRAGTLNDFAVDKDHRVAGAAIAIQRALAETSRPAGFDFLTGYPNRNSVRLFDRIGYHRLGDCYLWVKPLRSAYKVSQLIRPAALARMAALAVDAVLLADDVRKLARGIRRYRGELCDRADSAFDELWARARERYRVVGERSAAFLNWRYGGSRTQRYRFYRLRERAGGSMAGYVAFTRSDDRRPVVVDVLATGPEDDVLDDLLLRFAAHMRAAGEEAISMPFLGAGHFERRLTRLGFIRREDFPRTLIVYLDKGAPSELRPVLLDKEHWMLFEGEMDL